MEIKRLLQMDKWTNGLTNRLSEDITTSLQDRIVATTFTVNFNMFLGQIIRYVYLRKYILTANELMAMVSQ